MTNQEEQSAEGAPHSLLHVTEFTAEKKNGWKPPRERFGATEYLLIAAAVSAFLFGALLTQLDAAPDSYDAVSTICTHVPPVAEACHRAIASLHEQTHTFAHYDFILLFSEAFKALSIALMVSIFVAGTLDRRNKEKLNQTLTAKAEEIADNVFTGIFGNRHWPELLEMLKKQILDKSIVRDRMEVTYTLSQFEPPIDSRVAGNTYVEIRAMVSAQFTNIAVSQATASTQTVELAVSLPNPYINELKDHVRLVSAAIKTVSEGEQQVSEISIANINRELRQSLENDELAEGLAKFGYLTLGPGAQGSFEIVYVMIKEAEDSEMLRSFHTTKSLSLTVIDNTGKDLFVRADAVHPSKLQAISKDRNIQKWALGDIILPQQGIMVWWKRPPGAAKKPRRQRGVAPAQEAPT